jgi:Protein of unknown function (DUF2934)
MSASLEHRIRERAYEMWNAAGRMHGQAEQHWLAAERQLLSELAPQPTAQVHTTEHPTARVHTTEQKKPAPVRQRRPLTNVRPQPKKAANGG